MYYQNIFIPNPLYFLLSSCLFQNAVIACVGYFHIKSPLGSSVLEDSKRASLTKSDPQTHCDHFKSLSSQRHQLYAPAAPTRDLSVSRKSCTLILGACGSPTRLFAVCIVFPLGTRWSSARINTNHTNHHTGASTHFNQRRKLIENGCTLFLITASEGEICEGDFWRVKNVTGTVGPYLVVDTYNTYNTYNT